MAIPEHICLSLGCPDNLTKADFAAYLESLPDGNYPWFLEDQVARDALVDSLFSLAPAPKLVILSPAHTIDSCSYLELGDPQGHTCCLLKVSANFHPGCVMPTGALTTLAKFWQYESKLIDDESEGQLSKQFHNSILVFSMDGLLGWGNANLELFLASLMGCRLSASTSVSQDPHWASYGRIEIERNALASEALLMSGCLMQEVLFERRVRWRYIALYRIFEAAYLVGLKKSLDANFIENPKQALALAQTALESELSTFKALVEEQKLETKFNEFREVVDSDDANRFFHAIKRSLRNSKSSNHQKGAEYCYKIRCAIVHAGQGDVVFDRFADAESGVSMLLKNMETAVIELLGLRAGPVA